MTPAQPVSAPIEALSTALWDVAVVGGGPAGAVAALTLARRGHRVVLIEAKAPPREKVCGDALLPDALEILSRLGLEEEVRQAGHRAHPARVYSPSRLWFDLPLDLVTIKRSRLDLILVTKAVEAGAVLGIGRVDQVSYLASGEVALGIPDQGTEVRSRAVILATGAQVQLLRQLGMVSRVAPNAVAIRGYVQSSVPEADCPLTISYDRQLIPGYGWIFPMGEGEYNVGVGMFKTPDQEGPVSLRKRLQRFVKEFPPARALFECGDWTDEPRGAPLRCGLNGSAASDGRSILAVGETIGTTYPLTGEGIGKAMATAYQAAGIIDAALAEGSLQRLARFDAELRQHLQQRFESYAGAQRLVARPLITDGIAWWARRNNYLRGRIAGVLQEWLEPIEILSGRRFFRLLTG